MEDWILPFAMPGALIVAAWLVEAKQNVVENIAPVLTRVFTPLTVVMLLTFLGVFAAAGGLADVSRDLLILMDAILVLVLCLLLYSISARDPTRIAEFGFSPNKVAALGLNLLLLVHLVRAAWLALGWWLWSSRRSSASPDSQPESSTSALFDGPSAAKGPPIG